MNKLQQNFEMDKYGLHVRLVNENDAEFIIKLRTDPKLSKFIHDTDADLQKQKEWICHYKEKESKGLEYYFIFFSNNIPVGLNRIYAIHENGIFTTGSWIFSQEAPLEAPIASALITREIAFEILNFTLEDSFDGCHENNKHVLRFNKMLGFVISGEILDTKGKYYTMTLTKESFLLNKIKIERLLKIN